MIDQLGRDPRILQVLLDLRGVFLVDLLRRAFSAAGFLRLEAGDEGEREQRDQRGDAGFHPPIVIRNLSAARLHHRGTSVTNE